MLLGRQDATHNLFIISDKLLNLCQRTQHCQNMHRLSHHLVLTITFPGSNIFHKLMMKYFRVDDAEIFSSCGFRQRCLVVTWNDYEEKLVSTALSE